MYKYKKVLLICFTFLLLAGIYTANFLKLNAKYSETNTVTAAMGEKLKVNDFEVVVSEFRMEDMEGEQPPYGKGAGKVLLIKAKVVNTSSEERKFPLDMTMLQSGAWVNGISIQEMQNYNLTELNLDDTFQGKEEIECVLPFFIFDFQLREGEWDQVSDRSFFWVLGVTPEKYMIKLEKERSSGNENI